MEVLEMLLAVYMIGGLIFFYWITEGWHMKAVDVVAVVILSLVWPLVILSSLFFAVHTVLSKRG